MRRLLMLRTRHGVAVGGVWLFVRGQRYDVPDLLSLQFLKSGDATVCDERDDASGSHN